MHHGPRQSLSRCLFVDFEATDILGYETQVSMNDRRRRRSNLNNLNRRITCLKIFEKLIFLEQSLVLLSVIFSMLETDNFGFYENSMFRDA